VRKKRRTFCVLNTPILGEGRDSSCSRSETAKRERQLSPRSIEWCERSGEVGEASLRIFGARSAGEKKNFTTPQKTKVRTRRGPMNHSKKTDRYSRGREIFREDKGSSEGPRDLPGMKEKKKERDVYTLEGGA